MKFRLLFCFSILLLLTFSSAVTACTPSCPDCYYWNGSYCAWECGGYECCGGDCEECCDDGDCYGCEDCYYGSCGDNDYNCYGCKSCESGSCVDDDDNCSGCRSCESGSCVDDDDNCSGCRSCESGSCVDDDDNCSGCKSCESGSCVDDDDNCYGCESCEGGDCEDDDDNCSGDDVCCDGDCEECCDDSNCSECYFCYHWYCKCNDVTGVYGISGPYYQGEEDNIVANLMRDLRPGCSVNWGGDASIVPRPGLEESPRHKTAVFSTTGENLTIWAQTGCQSQAKYSTTFAVVEISQFEAKSSNFPKCIGESISKSDFNITTNPTGYEGDVVVTGLSTSSAGNKTAEATLWGFPEPALEANYTIVGVDSIDVDKNYPCPGQNVEFTVTTNPSGNENLITWSDGGSPPTGEGASFTTSWSSSGVKTVTAACYSDSDQQGVTVVEVASVSEDKTTVAAGETITFTANSGPASIPLNCIEWESRYRANSGASWGSWGSASGGDNKAQLSTSTAGCYQYRARNGSSDIWKESSEVVVVGVDRVVERGGTNEGPLYTSMGGLVQLKAKPAPSDASFPSGKPVWSLDSYPTGGGGVAFSWDGDHAGLSGFPVAGDYTVSAECGSSDSITVIAVEVASVGEDKTTAAVGETVTFTATANPSGGPLGSIEWESRYRTNSGASWGSWGSASGGDNTAQLNTTTAGCYQYRARNSSSDTWKESSEVSVVEVASVSEDKTTAAVNEIITFTAAANPSGSSLGSIAWESRYRADSSASWGSWSSASGGDNTAQLSTSTAGCYQYRARNGSDDTWKESSEVVIVEVDSVGEDKTTAAADETVTFTAVANPSGSPLGSITWESRYRADSNESWGSWGSASGGDNTAQLSTSTAGNYQYRARNGSSDTWKESSEVAIVGVYEVVNKTVVPIYLGDNVTLKAIPNPRGAPSFPPGKPTWEVIEWPTGAENPSLSPSFDSPTTTVSNLTEPGNYKILASSGTSYSTVDFEAGCQPCEDPGEGCDCRFITLYYDHYSCVGCAFEYAITISGLPSYSKPADRCCDTLEWSAPDAATFVVDSDNSCHLWASWNTPGEKTVSISGPCTGLPGSRSALNIQIPDVESIEINHPEGDVVCVGNDLGLYADPTTWAADWPPTCGLIHWGVLFKPPGSEAYVYPTIYETTTGLKNIDIPSDIYEVVAFIEGCNGQTTVGATKQITAVELDSVTSDIDVACLNQNVTFSVTTNPPGYENEVFVRWWSEGANPSSQGGHGHVTGDIPFTTKWSSPGPKTVTASCFWSTGCSTEKAITVVGVDRLQYLSDTGYTDISGTLYVYQGTTVTFKALPNPSGASWPNGKPVWGGNSGASGTGETTAVTFNTLSTSTNDYKTVTVECGNTVTANVIVAKISQFYADPSKFPKCKGDSISEDDFIIVTDPTGYEGQVEVDKLSTATGGSHTAYATLWDKPETPLEANYTVVEVVSVASDKNSAELCEQIVFTATIIPSSGYESHVKWSGGGNPETQDGGDTFTTSWPCKGQETVTATCDCSGNSESKNVNITLPDGCEEGQEQVILLATNIDVTTERCDGMDNCGYTALPEDYGNQNGYLPEINIEAVYNNCAWVFDIEATVDVETGTCPEVIDISSGDDSDLSESTYCYIVDSMLNHAGCTYCSPVKYTNVSYCTIHELVHYAFYYDVLGDYADDIKEQDLPDPIAINCSDPDTITCQAVMNQYSSQLKSAVMDAFHFAMLYTLTFSEQYAIASVEEEFQDLGEDICDYAATQNWAPCSACPD